MHAPPSPLRQALVTLLTALALFLSTTLPASTAHASGDSAVSEQAVTLLGVGLGVAAILAIAGLVMFIEDNPPSKRSSSQEPSTSAGRPSTPMSAPRTPAPTPDPAPPVTAAPVVDVWARDGAGGVVFGLSW